MATVAPPRAPTVAPSDRAQISRLPYLPGLDGLRAIAVVAVMIYHANSAWLPGGFLGVEMFFVISGYLITLLLIAERERNYRISLGQFWLRRARRLLPAVFLMMLMVTLWTAIFERHALGQLRGDVLAGTFYVSNWYQIWEGLGYTASGDFAPLRHLWSLAVEEQFYLIWPIVMVLLLGRAGTRRVADVSRWLFVAAVAITVLVALAFHAGPIAEPSQTPEAYWWIGGRPISKLDTLYLSTFTRARRSAARRGVRTGVASVRGDARAAADQGSPVRRLRAARPRVPRLDVLGDPARHGRRCRPPAVPWRSVRGRPGDARTHRRGEPPWRVRRTAPRDAGARVDRPAFVRPVPLPLADLHDHPGRRRQPAVGARVRRGHGGHGVHHRAVVPVLRDADPPGRCLGRMAAFRQGAHLDPAAGLWSGRRLCSCAVGVRRRARWPPRRCSRTRSPKRSTRTRSSPPISSTSRPAAVAGGRRRGEVDAPATTRSPDDDDAATAPTTTDAAATGTRRRHRVDGSGRRGSHRSRHGRLDGGGSVADHRRDRPRRCPARAATGAGRCGQRHDDDDPAHRVRADERRLQAGRARRLGDARCRGGTRRARASWSMPSSVAR